MDPETGFPINGIQQIWILIQELIEIFSQITITLKTTNMRLLVKNIILL